MVGSWDDSLRENITQRREEACEQGNNNDLDESVGVTGERPHPDVVGRDGPLRVLLHVVDDAVRDGLTLIRVHDERLRSNCGADV